jgi:hypothetical protein
MSKNNAQKKQFFTMNAQEVSMRTVGRSKLLDVVCMSREKGHCEFFPIDSVTDIAGFLPVSLTKAFYY